MNNENPTTPATLTPEEWRRLAREAGQKLAWAVCHLKCSGMVYNSVTGGTKIWEDDVIETLLKFPGAKVNREKLMEKYLSAKERRAKLKPKKSVEG